MNATRCFSREELQAYALGKVATRDVDAMDEHLAGCASCWAGIETLSDVKDTLVERLRAPIPADEFAAEVECAQALSRAKSLVEILSSKAGGPEDTAASESIWPSVLGEYQLLELLGKGGMGRVFKSRHINLDKLVAVKLLPRHRMSDPTAVARFYREMKAIGKLAHPRVVVAHDAREIDGTHLLVMEYVEGMDLGKLIREHNILPIPEACQLICEAANGLQYVHEHGLVHRDLKPSNLMLTVEGEVKILDLGLALLGTTPEREEEVTVGGQLLGTPDYMAPEQADDAHHVDIRADVYSLGCTLYRLLTGEVPFGGPAYPTVTAKLLGHARDPVQSVRQLRPELPKSLAEVVARMMAKDPQQRFANMSEVADALRPFAVGGNLRRLIRPQDPTASRSLPDLPASPEHGDRGLTERRGNPACRSAVSAEHATDLRNRLGLRRPVWFLTTAMGFLFLAALAVIYIATDRGTLEITAHDPDVRVVVEQSGRKIAVLDLKTQSSIRLRPGEYQLRLGQDKSGFSLTPGQITLQRGRTVIAEVREVAASVRAPVASDTDPHSPPVDGIPWETEMPSSGGAVGPTTFVTRPPQLAGLRSWTVELRQPRGSVNAVAFSPDGRLWATGSEDGAIRLFPSGTKQLMCVLLGHDKSVRRLAWSPDNSTIASASTDKTVRLWDWETGRARKLEGHTATVTAVAFSRDGKTLATVSADRTVRLWDVARGKTRHVLPIQDDPSPCLGWSPDGRQLMVGHGNQVTLWDPETARPVKELRQDKAGIIACAWCPDGKLLATGDWQGTVTIWDPDQNLPLRTFPCSAGGVPSVSWSPDGSRLAAGTTANVIFVWERESWSEPRRLAVHESWVQDVAWSADGQILASASLDGTANLWDWAAQRSIGEPQSGLRQPVVAAMTWNEDGAALHIVATSGLTAVWEFPPIAIRSSGRLLPEAEDGWYSAAAWSPDRKHLVTCDSPKPVTTCWDIDAEKVKAAGSLDRVVNPVEALAWSPDGSNVAGAAKSQDGRFRISVWIRASGQILRTFGDEVGPISSLAWSPDGKSLASAGNFITLRLWDPTTGLPNAAFPEAQFGITSLAWSPDGKKLVCGMHDGNIQTRDGATGSPSSPPATIHAGKVNTIAISPDGKLVASYGEDRIIRIHDLKTGALQASLLMLSETTWLAVASDGHVRSSELPEGTLMYVVFTDGGQQKTLTPTEFAKQYSWTNDPQRVRLPDR